MNLVAKIGALFLLALGIGGFFILRINNLKIGKDLAYRYRVQLPNAQGLAERSSVFLQGVKVGRVAKLELHDRIVEAEIQIRRDVALREGSHAVVGSVGLLGEKQLDIMPGAEDAPLLAPNSVISGKNATSLDQVINEVGEVGRNVKDITGAVRDSLGANGGEQKLDLLLGGLTRVVDRMDQVLAANQGNAEATLVALRDFSNQMARFTRKLNEQVDLHRGDLSRGVDDLGEGLERLRQSSEHLESITGKVNQGQGTVGRLIDSPQTAERFERALADVEGGVSALSSTLDSVRNTRLGVGLEGNYLAALTRPKGYLRLDIQPPGDRFLRLELVGNPAVPGRAAEPLAYSAMLGWRFSPLVARAGLVESRLGAGADLLVWGDRLRFSADSWDFGRTGLAPHAKLQGSVDLARGLYLVGGWDDPLNRSNGDSLFLGAGVHLSR